jgi:predicted DNA-binding transcriptional regulator AlpA
MADLSPNPSPDDGLAGAGRAALTAAATTLQLVDPEADEMMSLDAVLRFFGGDRPIHYATLYRGIKAGRYPPPVSIGPNTRRWLRSQCREARQKLIDASSRKRDGEAD